MHLEKALNLGRMILLLVLGILIPNPSVACLWYDGYTLEGRLSKVGPVKSTPVASPLPQQYRTGMSRNSATYLRSIAKLAPEAALRKDGYELQDSHTPPEDWPAELNDAVAPLFTRHTEEALGRLESLHVQFPNNYWVNANLAAAYELSGQDAKALLSVETAMRIKPDAHFGTEWMHAAVLRGKLALAQDPDWLQSHTFSGIPIEGDVPKEFKNADGMVLTEIRAALVAHLVPRLLFIKGPDPVIAAMLQELARVEVRQRGIDDGQALLEMATEFGAKHAAALSQRWEQLKPGPIRRIYFSREGQITRFLLVALTVILLSYYVLKRLRHLRLRRKQDTQR